MRIAFDFEKIYYNANFDFLFDVLHYFFLWLFFMLLINGACIFLLIKKIYISLAK